MAQKTTKPIHEQRSALTKRQELDVRTKLMGKTTRILNKLVKVAEGAEEMSAMEFRASELILKKTLPDLSAVAHVQPDELADLGRDELIAILGGVLESQPQLAAVPEIRGVVNQAQSVNEMPIDVTPKPVDDVEEIIEDSENVEVS